MSTSMRNEMDHQPALIQNQLNRKKNYKLFSCWCCVCLSHTTVNSHQFVFIYGICVRPTENSFIFLAYCTYCIHRYICIWAYSRTKWSILVVMLHYNFRFMKSFNHFGYQVMPFHAHKQHFNKEQQKSNVLRADVSWCTKRE